MSYCDIAGRLVFLDLAKDRYFRLPPKMERTFRNWISREGECLTGIEGLFGLGVLVEAPDHPVRPTAHPHAPARKGALEREWIHDLHPNLRTVLSVFAIVLITSIELRCRTLKGALDALDLDRRRLALPTQVCTAASRDHDLFLAATMFRKARVFVPISPSCLLDSISLAKFLTRKKHYSSIVFGVTIDPFSAHCWVQSGNIVLSDYVGNVNAYTSIRTV